MNIHVQQDEIAFQANLYESKNPTRRYLHNARRDWVLNAIRRVCPPEPIFLEIGIGCAIYTNVLSDIGAVVAIDINPTFVEAANRLPNVTAHLADITNTSLEPIHDVALCSEVIEHFYESPAALKNIFSSLKPGGHLVLTTPNSFSTVELAARMLNIPLFVHFVRFIYGEPVVDLEHVNRMTHGTLRRQIVASGFEVLEQEDIALYIPIVAEFGGDVGMRICKWFGNRLKGTMLSWLLWDQCWILRKPRI